MPWLVPITVGGREVLFLDIMSTWAVEGGMVLEFPLMGIIIDTGAAEGGRMVESPLISNLGRKKWLVLFLLMECPLLDNLWDLTSILGTVGTSKMPCLVPITVGGGRCCSWTS